MINGQSSRFSVVAFAIAVVIVGIGTVAGLSAVPVVGSYVGMLLGGFLVSLVIEDRPLLEAGTAAGIASLAILMAGPLIGNGIVAAVSALGAIAPTTLLVSVALSFAVGAFGAHFGDDLRDGLNAPVETPAARPTASGSAPRQSTDAESSALEQVEDEPAAREPTEADSADSGSNDVTKPDWADNAADRDSETAESEMELDRNT